ncbi:HEAT repeat domain-containing protein [Candidatus Micrarchaeota archaeon]|nr:HEAT repeat domain-containing protein [Candidatus Micrarchaeota archaeon]
MKRKVKIRASKPSINKKIDGLVEQLKDKKAGYRSGAARSLGNIDYSGVEPQVAKEVVDALTNALKCENGWFYPRLVFVRTFGEIGDPLAFSALVGVLEDENEDLRVKKKAALALREINKKNPEGTLEELTKWMHSFEFFNLAKTNPPVFYYVFDKIHEILGNDANGGIINGLSRGLDL